MLQVNIFGSTIFAWVLLFFKTQNNYKQHLFNSTYTKICSVLLLIIWSIAAFLWRCIEYITCSVHHVTLHLVTFCDNLLCCTRFVVVNMISSARLNLLQRLMINSVVVLKMFRRSSDDHLGLIWFDRLWDRETKWYKKEKEKKQNRKHHFLHVLGLKEKKKSGPLVFLFWHFLANFVLNLLWMNFLLGLLYGILFSILTYFLWIQKLQFSKK